MFDRFQEKINSIYFVIPVFNETKVVELLDQINSFSGSLKPNSAKVLLIDDGSEFPIEISNEFSNIRVDVVRHQINSGPGAAFRTGIMQLPQDLGVDDYVVTMEGDCTSDLSMITKMATRINEGDEGYDLVLASPYMYGGSFESVSLYRRFLSSAANEMTRLILDLRGLWTLSCFYRLHRGSSLIRLRVVYGDKIIESDGFEGVVELLWKMKLHGFRISEIPSKISHDARSGKSKMRIFRTIMGYFRLWLVSYRVSR